MVVPQRIIRTNFTEALLNAPALLTQENTLAVLLHFFMKAQPSIVRISEKLTLIFEAAPLSIEQCRD